jgi:O-antigen ligase
VLSLVLRSRMMEAGRWGLVAVCGAVLLAKGGTPFPVVELLSIPLGLMTAMSVMEQSRNPAIRRLLGYVLVFTLCIAGLVALQVAPLGAFENPAWLLLRDGYGSEAAAAISVSPGQASWSLLRMLFPYALFLACLTYFQFERDIERLWWVVAFIGAAFAIYGILQLIVFPNWLLFTEKRYYLGSLTATIVNRNSAATFLGITLVVTICLLRWEVRSGADRRNQGKRMFYIAGFNLSPMLIALLAAAIVQILAIGLTESRGGLLSTVLALALTVWLLKFRQFKTASGKWVLRGTLAFCVLVILPLIAGRTLFRLETIAGNEGRICAFKSTWQAAQANFPFGTGLGTFQDVFPAYRSAACSIMGIWDKAHNSYLENLLEMGVFYPVFLLVGTWIVLSTLIKGLGKRREMRPFVVGGLGVTLLVSVHALVDFSLQIPAVAAFYALILGSAMTTALGRSGRSGG